MTGKLKRIEFVNLPGSLTESFKDRLITCICKIYTDMYLKYAYIHLFLEPTLLSK